MTGARSLFFDSGFIVKKQTNTIEKIVPPMPKRISSFPEALIFAADSFEYFNPGKTAIVTGKGSFKNLSR